MVAERPDVAPARWCNGRPTSAARHGPYERRAP